VVRNGTRVTRRTLSVDQALSGLDRPPSFCVLLRVP
jgi:hypothetical protein